MRQLVLGFFFLFIGQASHAQTKVNPVIKNFGTITEVPFSLENPDPTLNYKIVVEVSTEHTKPEQVHEFFEKVAAVVNLHALAGVPANKRKIVMVIHGPASLYVLNNAAYQLKYHMDNPNIPLFKELEAAGVKLLVCGQSLNKRNVKPSEIAQEIKPALSAITTLTYYQLKGYAFLKY